MIARGSWILLLCLSSVLAFAGEPEGAEAPRQSQVPRRRIRRTYDQQIQIHQPGSEAPIAPPKKESFVPGGVPETKPGSDSLLIRPTSSPPAPPQPEDPRRQTKKDGNGEDEEDEDNDLWVLKSPLEVLGVSTGKSAVAGLGGWIAEDMESRNRSEKKTEEEEEQELVEGENPNRVPLLTVQQKGTASLQARVETLSSNTEERARTSAAPGAGPEPDRFAPQSGTLSDRVALIRDGARPPEPEPKMPEPPLPNPEPEKRSVESAAARATPPPGAGSFSTKWEPPTHSPTRVPDSSAGSYGRMGAVFSPEPAGRSPSSLNLPPPGAGFGSGPPSLPDRRFKAYGTPGPLLPPLQPERSPGLPNNPVQPFLPTRYNP